VYIAALAATLRSALDKLAQPPEAVIASFHGMPQRYLAAGDPYHCQCQKTSRLLREELGWTAAHWHTAFQSRFGSEPWLRPYTIEEVERLAKSGVRRLAIIAPGFSADCLETLEELDMENRAVFAANGGEQFTYVPCLNDSAQGMRVIETLVRRELAGWM
jgi:ferrochelatase